MVRIPHGIDRMGSAGDTASSELFRLLVESVKDYAIFLLDTQGVVRSWNAGAERIKGYRAEEIIGKHFSTFYPESDRASGKPDAELREALARGRVEDHGWRIRKDGSQFWADVVITTLRDASGTHVGFAKVTRDLTDVAYRRFVEATNAIVWTADARGDPSADSPSWRAFTGQSLEEFVSTRGWGAVDPDDAARAQAEWQRAAAENRPFEAELRLRRRDGEHVWMSARAVPFSEPGGPIREWFGALVDISSRKLAEHERESALAWWTTTLRSIADAVIASDAGGNVRFMNPVAEELTGWTVAEAIGRPLAEVFTVVDETTRAPIESPVALVLRERRRIAGAGDTTLIRRDGAERPIEHSAAPIAAGEGALDGVVVVFHDVTERHRETARRELLAHATDELIRSTDHREALATVAHLAIPRLADWCAVEFVEPSERGSTQIAIAHVDPRKVALARELNERYPPGPDAPTGVPQVIRTGRPELYTHIPAHMLESAARGPEHLRLLRELDPRSAMIVPLHGRDRVLGAITFVFSRSGRRYGEDDLAFAQELAARAALIVERRKVEEDAAAANRAKDEFLATVSHELRTPLNAILGWSTLLQRGGLRDTDRAVDALVRNARAQARLVDDLLDVSRIVSGKLRLSISRVDLAAAITAAVEALRPAAAAKGIELLVDVGPDVGAVDGDFDRLQQVVWNLVSNAVKFTDRRGSVWVRAGREGDQIRIVVEDTGKGIAREDLDRIFRRFSQVDGSTTRRHGGLGLGLAIVRSLVEAHGGSVQVRSEGLGRGAAFTVLLPARASTAPVASARPADVPPRPLEGVRVLVVDDDVDAREIVAETLAAAGASPHTAGSAPAAYQALVHERPHVLVSDLAMPEEDGFSLIRRIRALPPERGGDTPAIALTSYARSEDARASQQAGFDLHVAKPIDADRVVGAVASLLGRVA